MPAAGPKLRESIDQALVQLSNLAVHRDYGRTRDSWPAPAKIWGELLEQTKRRMIGDIAPNLLKGDISCPIGINVTGRQWKSFERWYDRHVRPELIKSAGESGIRAIRAVRVSDRKGGRPESSEAVYFLAYIADDRCLDADTVESSAKSPAANVNEKLRTECFADDASRSIAVAGSERNSAASPVSGVPDESVGATLLRNDNSNSGSSPKFSATIRWRFGLSMVLLGIFTLALCGFLPSDSRRLLFVGCSTILLVVGLWDMDRGNKGVPR